MDDLIASDNFFCAEFLLLMRGGFFDSGPALRACMEASAPQEVCDKIEQAVLAANNPYQDNYTALYVQCGY